MINRSVICQEIKGKLIEEKNVIKTHLLCRCMILFEIKHCLPRVCCKKSVACNNAHQAKISCGAWLWVNFNKWKNKGSAIYFKSSSRLYRESNVFIITRTRQPQSLITINIPRTMKLKGLMEQSLPFFYLY